MKEFDLVLDAGSGLFDDIIWHLLYTIASPLMEAKEGAEKMRKIAKMGETHILPHIIDPAERAQFEASRRRLYTKLTLLAATPLVIAAGASIGVFYLNLSAATYVDILFKSFLDLGSVDLEQNLVWANFANYMMMYGITYLSSQFISAMIGAVSGACATEIANELQSEWRETLYDPRLKGALLVELSSGEKTTNAGSANKYMRGTVENSMKMTSSYVSSVVQTVMAFSSLAALDPMFMYWVVGFNLGANIVYTLLTHVRNKYKAELREEQTKSGYGYWDGFNNAGSIATQQLLPPQSGIVRKTDDKIARLEQICSLLEQACTVVKGLIQGARFSITYFLIGKGLSSGALSYEQRSIITACFEAITEFFASRGTFDEVITTLREFLLMLESIVKVIAEPLRIEVSNLAVHNRPYIEAQNLEIRAVEEGVPDKLIMLVNNAKFAQGHRHFFTGDNGAGKSTLLKAMKGVPSALKVSGQVLLPVAREGDPRPNIMYLPGQPFIFKNHNDPIDTIIGNITLDIERLDISKLTALKTRILNGTNGGSSLLGHLHKLLEAKIAEIEGDSNGNAITAPLQQTAIQVRQRKYREMLSGAQEAINELRNSDDNNREALVRALAKALLHLVNFGELAERLTEDAEHCSMGQIKAISFVRAILVGDDIYMFDETFNHLTEINKEQIARVLDVCLPNVTMFIVNHEPDVARIFKEIAKDKVCTWRVGNTLLTQLDGTRVAEQGMRL